MLDKRIRRSASALGRLGRPRKSAKWQDGTKGKDRGDRFHFPMPTRFVGMASAPRLVASGGAVLQSGRVGLQNLLEPLAGRPTAPFAGLLVVGGPLHFSPNSAAFDQLLETLQSLIHRFTGPQPHLQHKVLRFCLPKLAEMPNPTTKRRSTRTISRNPPTACMYVCSGMDQNRTFRPTPILYRKLLPKAISLPRTTFIPPIWRAGKVFANFPV